jgi:hypothetical protein
MFELLAKLIDKLIELSRERSSERRQYYEVVIEPIIRELAAIHVDVMKCYRSYAECLQDTKCDFDDSHPIFQKLDNDLRYALPARHGISRMLPRDLNTSGEVKEFVRAVETYMGVQKAAQVTTDPRGSGAWGMVSFKECPPRYEHIPAFYEHSLDHNLKVIAKKDDKPNSYRVFMAKFVLDRIVDHLTDSYGRLIEADTKLRHSLLLDKRLAK